MDSFGDRNGVLVCCFGLVRYVFMGYRGGGALEGGRREDERVPGRGRGERMRDGMARSIS